MPAFILLLFRGNDKNTPSNSSSEPPSGVDILELTNLLELFTNWPMAFPFLTRNYSIKGSDAEETNPYLRLYFQVKEPGYCST